MSLKDAFTGNDNTLEFIFVGGGTALAVGLFLAGYDVIKHGNAFNMEQFGNGLGWLFGGMGIGYGGKKFGDSRPNAPDTDGNSLTTTQTSTSTLNTVQPVIPTPPTVPAIPAAPAIPVAPSDQPQA